MTNTSKRMERRPFTVSLPETCYQALMVHAKRLAHERKQAKVFPGYAAWYRARRLELRQLMLNQPASTSPKSRSALPKELYARERALAIESGSVVDARGRLNISAAAGDIIEEALRAWFKAQG